MAQIGVDSIADLTSFGAATGSIWVTVPQVGIEHYTSPSLSVGGGAGTGQPRLDFSPTSASVGVAFSSTLSAGGDQFLVSVGSTAKALYVGSLGQVVNDTWTRTS